MSREGYLLIAAIIIALGLAFHGMTQRYTFRTWHDSGRVVVLDRLTGEIWHCEPDGCQSVQELERMIDNAYKKKREKG